MSGQLDGQIAIVTGGSGGIGTGLCRALAANGATVIQSLAPTPWGAPYGMLTDRFGVTWIVGTSPA